MTRDEWVKAFRAEVDKRIREYEAMPDVIKANGFARLACADSIAEIAAENAKLLETAE
jgi:hypothetical protein